MGKGRESRGHSKHVPGILASGMYLHLLFVMFKFAAEQKKIACRLQLERASSLANLCAFAST